MPAYSQERTGKQQNIKRKQSEIWASESDPCLGLLTEAGPEIGDIDISQDSPLPQALPVIMAEIWKIAKMKELRLT